MKKVSDYIPNVSSSFPEKKEEKGGQKTPEANKKNEN